MPRSPQTAVGGRLRAVDMAPKRVKASEIVPKEVGALKLPLHEFDVGEESGWRSLNDDRVAELLKEFLDGHVGMNVMEDPMVRAVAGEPKRSADYKVLLADGKHKVVALQRVRHLRRRGEV